jgi:hypothetical protein
VSVPVDKHLSDKVTRQRLIEQRILIEEQRMLEEHEQRKSARNLQRAAHRQECLAKAI